MSSVVLSKFGLGEFKLAERSPSSFSNTFDGVGGEETTVDTSILLEIAFNEMGRLSVSLSQRKK
jgi:hypothetical protein